MEIPLGGHRGGTALVDDEDAERVLAHSWSRTIHGYVAGQWGYLHRFVLGLQPGDGWVVDHRNGDRLDNRKTNLAIGDQSSNMQNVTAHRDARSRFRGVSWSQSNRGWIAQVMIRGKRRHLGTFRTEGEAAEAVEGALNANR